MNKKAKILFFCMIFVARAIFCQNPLEKSAISPNFYSSKPFTQSGIKANIKTEFLEKKNSVISRINTVSPKALLIPHPYFALAADYYTKDFGFFCKKELQFEKATKLPFRFRLGSVQYCDWMEGKKTAGIRPNN